MRLRKSKDDVLLTGLLGGIGEYLGIDPTFIRIGFALLTTVSAFPMIPLYIIAALIVPDAKPEQTATNKTRKNKQTIDKKRDRPHNMDSLSETQEIDEEDWSDF